MQTVLVVVHLMVVVALVAVVLLQRSEGGALGIGGGGGFMTGRGQANALTKATAILATIFFVTSLALTIIANVHRAPTSIFDQAQPGAPAPSGQTPAAPGGSLLDQLRQLDDQRQQQAPAPAAPGSP
jgi:preprotein translocase subunit SecG